MGQDSRVEFTEVVRRRRMVRTFEQRPVSRDKLERILDVARRGPSAGFSQGFDFVVLDQPDRVKEFWATTAHPDFHDPDQRDDVLPPVIVIPVSNKGAYLSRYSEGDKAQFGLQTEETWPVPFWTIDTGMAVMLMLLAAVDLGLGGWYFGIPHGQADLMQRLGVPEEHEPIGAVAIGYTHPDDRPTGSSQTRRRRPLDELVHWNGW
jgi:nitroreductase